MDAQQARRKRLRVTNSNFESLVEKAVTGHINEATKFLSKAHASLCSSTRTMQDVRRDVRVACEEVTELSVECMDLSKRRCPFFATRNTAATASSDGTASSNFSKWEQLAGVSSKQDNRYPELLSNDKWKSSYVASQITKDLPRTPSFGSFKVNVTKLEHVLQAYSLLDPQCSYVQGMNTITSFLLSKQDEDERVFWLLAQVLGKGTRFFEADYSR
jgi:hypothetical protein